MIVSCWKLTQTALGVSNNIISIFFDNHMGLSHDWNIFTVNKNSRFDLLLCQTRAQNSVIEQSSSTKCMWVNFFRLKQLVKIPKKYNIQIFNVFTIFLYVGAYTVFCSNTVRFYGSTIRYLNRRFPLRYFIKKNEKLQILLPTKFCKYAPPPPT